MREHRLLQPKRSEGRRKRPGYVAVTRPDELWHMDMTSVWVAEHGWVYLNAIIDCCTREICGWAIDVRCRATVRSWARSAMRSTCLAVGPRRA
jgi:putative transposase